MCSWCVCGKFSLETKIIDNGQMKGKTTGGASLQPGVCRDGTVTGFWSDDGQGEGEPLSDPPCPTPSGCPL